VVGNGILVSGGAKLLPTSRCRGAAWSMAAARLRKSFRYFAPSVRFSGARFPRLAHGPHAPARESPDKTWR